MTKKLLAIALLAFTLTGCRQMLGGQAGIYLNGDGSGCSDASMWGKCKMKVQCCAEKDPWACHCTEKCPCYENHGEAPTSGKF